MNRKYEVNLEWKFSVLKEAAMDMLTKFKQKQTNFFTLTTKFSEFVSVLWC